MNGYQAMGKTSDVLEIDHHSLFRDWSGDTLDGHDFEKLDYVIKNNHILKLPYVIFARTIKGKDVSFMENNNQYHYLKVDDDDYEKALRELSL